MSEEEKTLEDQTETIIDAIENETEDDVREAFEVNKEDGPLAALGAPLIRAAGDPDPADPNMIQKHLDNFLAKIAGETPIDETVRDSTEYWLNRIAGIIPDNLGKQLYYHPIALWKYSGDSTSISMIVLNDRAERFMSASQFLTWVRTAGITYLCPVSGSIYDPAMQKTMILAWIDIRTDGVHYRGHYVGDTTEGLRDYTVTDETFALNEFSDNGVNRIL